MKTRIVLTAAALAALGACGSRNDENGAGNVSSKGVNATDMAGVNATELNAGSAVTNTGTGVTGAGGAQTVTGKGSNIGRGKTGGNANDSGAGPSAPGTR
jgi:hypothetical protein